ncbi:MAG: type II toxin-antitoxin system HicA family toxin [Limisphaerales bacterium]
MKRRELIRHLATHGCTLLREGARHSVWVNPDTGQKEAIPRHAEIDDHLARKICRGFSISDPKK